MKPKTKQILAMLKIVAVAAIIGYIVVLGSQIFTLLVSLAKPEASRQIYTISFDYVNLYDLRTAHFTLYLWTMSFLIALTALHAFVWFYMFRLLSRLNLEHPFSKTVSRLLEKTAAQLLCIWLISHIATQSIRWIGKNAALEITAVDPVNEYLFVAGVVFVISQVFKRGVELQEENELTV